MPHKYELYINKCNQHVFLFIPLPTVCIMGRHCCTTWGNVGCTSNYPRHDVVTTYKLPSDPYERELWINALPNEFKSDPEKAAVCAKHWPEGFVTVKKKGSVRPRDPPSLFGIPNSSRPQTPARKSRDADGRNCTASARLANAAKAAEAKQVKKDSVNTWLDFVDTCDSLTNELFVKKSQDSVTFLKVEGTPPEVKFSVKVESNFQFRAYRGSFHVPSPKLVNTYGYCITKKSQLLDIFRSLESYDVDIDSELAAFGNKLKAFCAEHENVLDDDKQRRLLFISSQLVWYKVVNYSREDLMVAMTLFLSGRKGYCAMRNYLLLPHVNTLLSFFGRLGSPGSIQNCSQTVSKVFDVLDKGQKACFVSIDEINIKSNISYTGSHIVGQAADMPDKAAGSVLTFMVNTSFGAPSFVCRIVPVHSLKADFLFDQTKLVIKVLHDCGGSVFMLMSDNLSVNQKLFSLFHSTFGSKGIFAVAHPIKNPVFPLLYLLYDPVHLLKNIRNNWLTEKLQQLSFPDPSTGECAVAKWSDVIAMYKKDSLSMLRMTKLSPPALWPTSFEKQKVFLALQVFDDKVVAAMKQNDTPSGTVTFIAVVTRMWHILNSKSPEGWFRLNDPDRSPISSSDDPRLTFLENLGKSFKLMDSCQRGKRVKALTTDTANALHVTLLGLADMTRTLLRTNFDYVLLGKYQSDRIEGEFGKWRQMVGGNYFISVEQIQHCLNLCHLKLFHDLEVGAGNDQLEDCCLLVLDNSDPDLDLVVNCFVQCSELSKEERSVTYYIAGYIAKKENLAILGEPPTLLEESEFTSLVSRGKLTHPSKDLFELACYCFTFFKLRSDKCCNNIFVQAFMQIYQLSKLEIDGNISRIVRRLVNCFFKAYAASCNTESQLDKREIKRRRVSKRTAS